MLLFYNKNEAVRPSTVARTKDQRHGKLLMSVSQVLNIMLEKKKFCYLLRINELYVKHGFWKRVNKILSCYYAIELLKKSLSNFVSEKKNLPGIR